MYAICFLSIDKFQQYALIIAITQGDKYIREKRLCIASNICFGLANRTKVRRVLNQEKHSDNELNILQSH